jgi:hypothetical protein
VGGCSLLFGANANNGVNAGVRNSNANNVPTNTNTNISAQLSAQFLSNRSLASRAKNKTSSAALVVEKAKKMRQMHGIYEKKKRTF